MIRKLTKDDRQAYMEMATDFYAGPALSHPLPDSVIVDNFEAAVSDDNPYLDGFLFEDEGKPVGFGMVSKSFSTMMGGLDISIEDAYVIPEYQGKGFGRSFFEFVTAKYDTARRFILEVMPDNEKAIALYDRLGFELSPYQHMKLDM